MIPIKDDNPTHQVPLITIGLIMANILVFLHQLSLGRGEEVFIYRFGAIPYEITRLQNFPASIGSLFTSMFLHGGPFHLLGNMLYLWIFGDNVEYIMGHLRFLGFYLLCGLAAALSHILAEPNSILPMVGASGAISGVLGAYFLRFPRAKVLVLVPLFFWFIRIIRIPAFFVLGFWFLMQVMSGFMSLGISVTGGVAWFAHIGGFLAGMILVRYFEKRRFRVWW